MTDDRLREAEREFRETGDVAAETRLLTERVRAGLLAPERLELAAELRYEPAVLAHGGPRGPRTHAVRELVESLERFGPEAIIRAFTEIARRTTPRGGPLQRTEAAVQALDAWLACPCERHRTELAALRLERVQAAATFAVRVALGGARPTDAHMLAHRRHGVPDSMLTAAVRRALVAWALAPHAPRPGGRASPGTILDLRVGCTDSPETYRLLLSADRVELGGSEPVGIHLDRAPGCEGEIVRTGDGFAVKRLAPETTTGVNADHVAESPLSTGDVVTLGDVWLEVTVLEAPFDETVGRATVEAERLLARAHEEEARRRIELAALCSDLGATLAAARAGITLRPRFDVTSWAVTLRRVPALPAAGAALALARETRPLFDDAFPETSALDRALEAAQAWVAAPSETARNACYRLGNELFSQLRRARHPGVDPKVSAAGSVAYGCVRIIAGQDALPEAAQFALAAGVPGERVRALMEAELIRWARG